MTQHLTPDASTLPTMQQAVLAWFRQHARDLPWRTTRDPYQILVAEMMLQQTQVERVVPKYHAFLEAFPTLSHLAEAATADVIRLWAGLGYNRRAVNLQRIARLIVSNYGGEFPRSVAALQQLPGIGAYTAGAIACFAFEQDVAFLDTNIRRVIRRAWVAPEDMPPPTPDRVLQQLGAELVPAGQGWYWNQAIMELGALRCTARAPTCWQCPLQHHCRSYAEWRTRDEQLFAAPDGIAAYPRADQPPRRRAAERPETPFVGSNRYYRGRVVDLLRALPPDTHLPITQLGVQLKPTFAADTEQAWLERLLHGLHRDGLIVVADGEVQLPR